jgi:hypothetical protein
LAARNPKPLRFLLHLNHLQHLHHLSQLLQLLKSVTVGKLSRITLQVELVNAL